MWFGSGLQSPPTWLVPVLAVGALACLVGVLASLLGPRLGLSRAIVAGPGAGLALLVHTVLLLLRTLGPGSVHHRSVQAPGAPAGAGLPRVGG